MFVSVHRVYGFDTVGAVIGYQLTSYQDRIFGLTSGNR